jgi:hypothetical protein
MSRSKSPGTFEGIDAFSDECISRASDIAKMSRSERRTEFAAMLTRLAVPEVQLEALRELFEDIAAAAAKVRAQQPSAIVTQLLADIRGKDPQ